MPVVPFIPLIIGAVGAVAKGIGGAGSKTGSSTSQTDSSFTNSGDLTKQQKALMKQLFGALSGALEQGPNVPQFARNTARAQINNTFDTIRPRLESSLTARGFGQSGNLGAGFKDLEYQRAKAFQGSEADLRTEAQNRYMQMLGLSQGFIKPYNFSGTSSQTGSGTQTVPGTGLLAGLGGAGQDIGGLLQLFQLLGGGGGGGGPITGDTGSFLGG